MSNQPPLFPFVPERFRQYHRRAASREKFWRVIEIQDNGCGIPPEHMDQVGDQVPIIGVVMSPFSLPVMQMGFDRYLDLMFEEPDLFSHLMKINQSFCIQWANAQLAAGATAICYFDPVSSSTIISREMYLKTGFEIARQTLKRTNDVQFV